MAVAAEVALVVRPVPAIRGLLIQRMGAGMEPLLGIVFQRQRRFARGLTSL